MPVLILAVSKDFDKLFKYSGMTAIAPLCKFGRIVIMTEYVPLMLVVAVLRAKNSRTYRTRKVLDIVLTFKSCNI